MPVKNMNDFILVFLSLHILYSALNQRNTNPFVVYRHFKNKSTYKSAIDSKALYNFKVMLLVIRVLCYKYQSLKM